jgi:predicted outer membrane repeat protein
MRSGLIAALVLLSFAQAVRADSVVTLCSTDTQSGAGRNLRDAIAGGGRITFSCPSATVIRITQPHNLDSVTEIDGGNQITLDGGGATSIFVSKGGLHGRTLALRRLAIRGGKPDAVAIIPPGQSGAITIVFNSDTSHAIFDQLTITDTERPVYFAFGTLQVLGSRFTNNTGPVLDVGTNVATVTVSVSATVFQRNLGAAITGFGAALTIDNVEVAGRSDGSDLGSSFNGGTLTVRNSRFHDIWGGKQCGGALQTTASTTISNTTFTNNRSNCGGGAVYIWGAAADVHLNAITCENNQSNGRGGAIAVDDPVGPVDIRFGEFRNNHALWGGGVSLYGASTHFTATAAGLSFKSNSADLIGGALYVDRANLQLQRGIFVDNQSSKGATVAFEANTPPWLLANVLIARNTGTAAVAGADGSLVNSTITVNNALGVALSGRVRVTNTVLANNLPQNCQFSGAGALDNGGSNVQFPTTSCAASVAVADPMLDEFFVPAPESPLQNAGIDSICLAAPVFGRDVYGQHRPRATHCTIGAVEGDIDQLLHHLGTAGPKTIRDRGAHLRHNKKLWLIVAVLLFITAMLLVFRYLQTRHHHHH